MPTAAPNASSVPQLNLNPDLHGSPMPQNLEYFFMASQRNARVDDAQFDGPSAWLADIQAMWQIWTKLGVQLGNLHPTGEDHYPPLYCDWLTSDTSYSQKKRAPSEPPLTRFANISPRPVCRISNYCRVSRVVMQSSDPYLNLDPAASQLPGDGLPHKGRNAGCEASSSDYGVGNVKRADSRS